MAAAHAMSLASDGRGSAKPSLLLQNLSRQATGLHRDLHLFCSRGFAAGMQGAVALM